MAALNTYAGTRALVTGAGGFIGSHLCQRLRDSGADVRAVLRKHSGSAEIASKLYQGDLCETEWSRKLISDLRPQFVFHLAGEVTGSRAPDRVMPTLRGNLVTTL